jgi:thiamine-phosphate pyrophosphorylase
LKKRLLDIDYYFITDSGLTRRGILPDVEDAVRAGCRIIQYREKEKSAREMIAEAREIKRICCEAILIINDRVDVALSVDADGVHLGQKDMDARAARKLLGDKIIGVTVHNVKEAVDAEKKGADYLGVSPIFTTGTKTDAGEACGTGMIAKIRSKTSLPIVAIGGITKHNALEVMAAGADSVAAISATVCSDDVKKEVKKFIEIIRAGKKPGITGE